MKNFRKLNCALFISAILAQTCQAGSKDANGSQEEQTGRVPASSSPKKKGEKVIKIGTPTNFRKTDERRKTLLDPEGNRVKPTGPLIDLSEAKKKQESGEMKVPLSPGAHTIKTPDQISSKRSQSNVSEYKKPSKIQTADLPESPQAEEQLHDTPTETPVRLRQNSAKKARPQAQVFDSIEETELEKAEKANERPKTNEQQQYDLKTIHEE